MQNKLRILSAALLAATALGLASCDEVEASLTPTDAEAVLINGGEGKLAGNTLGDLYDQIVSAGSTNSEKVLNNILYKLAQSYFGDFYGENGLWKTVTTGTDAEIKAYAEAHSTMFGGDANKVKIFYGKIKESFDKSFWSIVKNTSYQKRSYFQEKEFVQAQLKELCEFPELGETESYKDVKVVGYKTYLNVNEYFHTDYVEYYQNYIERNLLPDAYRKALVEQHLISQNYNTLGRSGARKVQYVALGSVEGFPHATEDLTKAYATVVLTGTDESIKAINENIDLDEVRNLHFLDRLYKGYFEGEEANLALASYIYDKAKFNKLTVTIDGVATTLDGVWEQTSYGLLLKDYYKLTDSRWEEGSTTDFTGGSAYTKEAGLKIKTDEILVGSNVTEGWYTSSGLSDLPSSLRSRLFRVNVANDLDAPETHTPDYVTVHNGRNYLTQKSWDMGQVNNFCVNDSSKWYIVRVDEAVKGPKLQKGGNSAYPAEKMDQIVADVASLIADGDTYKKAARQYYVKNAALEYHDQDVYDYFESTFPDLFD